MDPHAALCVLALGCTVFLALSVLIRVATARMVARTNRTVAELLHRLGNAENVIISQGDDIARLSGKVHDLELAAEARCTPNPQRLGIDVRGVG